MIHLKQRQEREGEKDSNNKQTRGEDFSISPEEEGEREGALAAEAIGSKSERKQMTTTKMMMMMTKEEKIKRKCRSLLTMCVRACVLLLPLLPPPPMRLACVRHSSLSLPRVFAESCAPCLGSAIRSVLLPRTREKQLALSLSASSVQMSCSLSPSSVSMRASE